MLLVVRTRRQGFAPEKPESLMKGRHVSHRRDSGEPNVLLLEFNATVPLREDGAAPPVAGGPSGSQLLGLLLRRHPGQALRARLLQLQLRGLGHCAQRTRKRVM